MSFICLIFLNNIGVEVLYFPNQVNINIFRIVMHREPYTFILLFFEASKSSKNENNFATFSYVSALFFKLVSRVSIIGIKAIILNLSHGENISSALDASLSLNSFSYSFLSIYTFTVYIRQAFLCFTFIYIKTFTGFKKWTCDV